MEGGYERLLPGTRVTNNDVANLAEVPDFSKLIVRLKYGDNNSSGLSRVFDEIGVDREELQEITLQGAGFKRKTELGF
ncbi:hypothetical protein KM043_011823 [Ampulex compressa]|nr:hypothetical protein KM043_011823 [Ampulex compressa]